MNVCVTMGDALVSMRKMTFPITITWDAHHQVDQTSLGYTIPAWMRKMPGDGMVAMKLLSTFSQIDSVRSKLRRYIRMCMCMCVYIYIYVHIHDLYTHTIMYLCMYLYPSNEVV